MRSSPFGAGGPRFESIALPRDTLGFVRRECATCHRAFKVRGTALEGRVAQGQIFAHVAHANRHEAEWPATMRHCPYCGASAPDDRWFTREQSAFLEARAKALVQELRYEQLAHVERTLDENPSPTYLAVRPERSKAVLSAERDDMQRVSLLCCREELKILESWPGAIHCFFCGATHESEEPAARERLSRIFPGLD